MSFVRLAIQTKEIINQMYENSKNTITLKLSEEQKKLTKFNFKNYISSSMFIKDETKRLGFFTFTIDALQGRGKSVVACYECGEIFPINEVDLLPSFHKLIPTNWLSLYATFVKNSFLVREIEKLKEHKDNYLDKLFSNK